MSDKSVILVPTDFTTVGSSAIDYATQLAGILKAKIIIMHVVAKDSEAAKAVMALEGIASRLRGNGFDADHTIAIGNIFDDIGRVAKDVNAGLIVMGTHGVKGMQKIMG